MRGEDSRETGEGTRGFAKSCPHPNPLPAGEGTRIARNASVASVPKVPVAGEDHGKARVIGGFDHVVIAH